jgi:hypothetical protein
MKREGRKERKVEGEGKRGEGSRNRSRDEWRAAAPFLPPSLPIPWIFSKGT